MKKIIILFFLLVLSVSSKDYYVCDVPGIPVGKGKRLGGLYHKEKPKPKKIDPIDLSKEKLAQEGYERITLGSTISLIAFVVSIAFANPLTHRLSNYGVIGGAVWAGDGFMKLFIAEYLVWFCWIAAILSLFGILYKFKHGSIIKLFKTVKDGKQKLKESVA